MREEPLAIASKRKHKPDTAGDRPRNQTRWAREDEDVKLMLRFQAGDRDAFDELVRRNTVKIHALVYRFLGDREQLEDLTQEVFLRVHRTAARYQPTAKFSTWIYRIVANMCFNVLRSRKRAAVHVLDVSDPTDAESSQRQVEDEHSEAPSRAMDTRELAQQVAGAIAALPDSQRIAIVLSRYEHKSYEEIAEILDCSTMAVKSLLSRARGNLRAALGRRLGAG